MAVATSSTSTVVNVPVVSITGVVPTNSFDGFGNLFGTNLPVCQVLPKVHYMNEEQFKIDLRVRKRANSGEEDFGAKQPRMASQDSDCKIDVEAAATAQSFENVYWGDVEKVVKSSKPDDNTLNSLKLRLMDSNLETNRASGERIRLNSTAFVTSQGFGNGSQ